MGSTQSKLKLSPKERDLFALLPKKGQRVTTDALVEGFYADGGHKRPFNARKVIVNRMATIIRKREANGDKPRLCKSERAGPRSIEFWLE